MRWNRYDYYGSWRWNSNSGGNYYQITINSDKSYQLTIREPSTVTIGGFLPIWNYPFYTADFATLKEAKAAAKKYKKESEQ